MFTRREARTHLLKRMYVVSEVPKRMAELVCVVLYQAQFLGNIDETAKAPLMKWLNLRTAVFGR